MPGNSVGFNPVGDSGSPTKSLAPGAAALWQQLQVSARLSSHMPSVWASTARVARDLILSTCTRMCRPCTSPAT
jgi:hypothetical protein